MYFGDYKWGDKWGMSEMSGQMKGWMKVYFKKEYISWHWISFKM